MHLVSSLRNPVRRISPSTCRLLTLVWTWSVSGWFRAEGKTILGSQALRVDVIPGVLLFGVYSNKHTNKQTNKQTSKNGKISENGQRVQEMLQCPERGPVQLGLQLKRHGLLVGLLQAARAPDGGPGDGAWITRQRSQ